MAKLTELVCKNAKCEGQKVRKLSDGGGLYLWVFDNGSKYFNYRYKVDGKEKGLSLGVYPQVSLAEARQEARRCAELRRQGVDPSLQRKQRLQAEVAERENTFEHLAREWYGKQVDTWSRKHAEDVLRRLEINIFPEIGLRPIHEIDGPELLLSIEKIEARGATDLAHRVNGLCGQIFRYGIARGKCKFDIAASIVDALKPHERKHQPCIAIRQIPKLMQDINDYEAIGDEQTRLGLKLLAHLFPRTTELIEAEKTEFFLEEKLWEVPAERMKMQNPHLVPLTDPVIGYLQRLLELSGKSRYILPGRNAETHISNNTLLYALYRLAYKGRMTGHGFRAMASTVLNETGFNPDWIERQLAHVEENKVRGAYNRAQYLNDRRRMMEWWSSYLCAAESGESLPDPPSYLS